MYKQNLTTTKIKRWDERFFRACEELATWSSCLSRQIGVVIVQDKTIVSTGFNGPPRGIPHCGEARIARDASLMRIDSKLRHECPRRALGFASGQGLELCTAAHAETNAIVNAARLGISTLDTSMYMNCGVPCKECLKLIINAGITELVCTNTLNWYDELSKFLVQESDLTIRVFYHLDKRKET